MKTTLVLCTICEGTLRWGHIGDSRLYIFQGFRLKERTLDHSVPQMLAAAREIKEKEIRFHPDRNRLLKVMGTPCTGQEYEVGGCMQVNSKTSLLMCTDGFWELIDEKEMVRSGEIQSNQTNGEYNSMTYYEDGISVWASYDGRVKK